MEETFPLISGHISLDLVNTEVVRWGSRHNLLSSIEQLDLWIKRMNEIGALPTMEPALAYGSTDVLHALQHFRSTLRNILEIAIKEQQLQAKWTSQLEMLIEKAPFIYKIIEHQLTPIPVGNPVDSLLSLISFDALQLLANKEWKHLRLCNNPDCVLLFIDKRGRRKWCSMKICGNRVKVARHKSSIEGKEG
ncbi:putative RNA-binding Zn ribbon-like protein [Croceifilum oryzae]|uniref:RNA-binding Zn ribbon-like protein n=1 Tax=Croceifilum oryzae TaxID=1553429 RepID=A0AAJ1WRA3_9BACL|nr:CGNR zinc finger domain-containing protein [Croceifilum oryzae]MDQ0418332.1 putative RNA-binding Zn ribbon-like protein [Croceifilum oryzae]